MAEAREGISGKAAAEPSPVVGELQRDGVCQHRRAGQCVLPGEREGHRGEGCGRELGRCEAENECAFEGRAGVSNAKKNRAPKRSGKNTGNETRSVSVHLLRNSWNGRGA